MKNRRSKDMWSEEMAWTIVDISKLNGSKSKKLCLYSDVFTIENYACQISNKRSFRQEFKHKFNAKQQEHGEKYFISHTLLHDPVGGFISNDTCIIEVGISTLSQEQNGTTTCKEATNGKFINFKGLGQVDKAFVPLLEEACSWHPSLIECLHNRTRRFVEWAFTALGRVLHFLKNKKVKDMNEEACNHLQVLWDELETCGFDLAWLEPQVQFALTMGAYLESSEQVQRLKDNVTGLEMEMKKLEAKLATKKANLRVEGTELAEAEKCLEDARKELGKAEAGIDEKDINPDLQLGYGRP